MIVGYVLFRILPLQELYTHIEWPVVVLLGSMIPLGAALENSGGTSLIAESLIWMTDGWPAWASHERQAAGALQQPPKLRLPRCHTAGAALTKGLDTAAARARHGLRNLPIQRGSA